MARRSPWSVRTRVCNNTCAPSEDHGMCCLLQKRWLTHIPADYVVTPRCSHNSLDLAIRYPHDVSSAPMAISTEGEIWNNLPKRHAKTAPLPSISRTHAPTSD